jgi:hypothetical protein
MNRLEYGILYRKFNNNQTEQTRNGGQAPESLAVSMHLIPECDCENVVIKMLDTIALFVHSGSQKSDLVWNYKRYSSPSSPSRSVRHSIAWSCDQMNIINMKLLIPNERRSVQLWT